MQTFVGTKNHLSYPWEVFVLIFKIVNLQRTPQQIIIGLRVSKDSLLFTCRQRFILDHYISKTIILLCTLAFVSFYEQRTLSYSEHFDFKGCILFVLIPSWVFFKRNCSMVFRNVIKPHRTMLNSKNSVASR